MEMKLLLFIMVEFDVTDQLQIIQSALMKHLRETGMQWRSASAIDRLQERYLLVVYCVEGDFPPAQYATSCPRVT
jgi:hypothetical protein